MDHSPEARSPESIPSPEEDVEASDQDGMEVYAPTEHSDFPDPGEGPVDTAEYKAMLDWRLDRAGWNIDEARDLIDSDEDAQAYATLKERLAAARQDGDPQHEVDTVLELEEEAQAFKAHMGLGASLEE